MQQDLDDALRAFSSGLASCRCPGSYHALWSLLKIAGVGGGIAIERTVLEPLLQRLLLKGGHVLVAGAADDASLRLLVDCTGAGAARFTVADLCPAPLAQALAAGERLGVAVATRQSDLSALDASDPWDLVFLHYTLSFCDREARLAVLGNLARGLAPGGRVVCAVKFASAQDLARPDDAGGDWSDRVRQRLDERLAGHDAAAQRVHALLPAYALSRGERKRAQAAPDELALEFAASGLSVVEQLETPRARWASSAGNPTADRQDSVILVAARSTDAVVAGFPR